jgi:long-subunit acyl-CoA synthetase (AMP-forming)
MAMSFFPSRHRCCPQCSQRRLLVKGKVVMKGYYNMREETEKSLVQGWFYTGDTAIDEQAEIESESRKKKPFHLCTVIPHTPC